MISPFDTAVCCYRNKIPVPRSTTHRPERSISANGILAVHGWITPFQRTRLSEQPIMPSSATPVLRAASSKSKPILRPADVVLTDGSSEYRRSPPCRHRARRKESRFIQTFQNSGRKSGPHRIQLPSRICLHHCRPGSGRLAHRLAPRLLLSAHITLVLEVTLPTLTVQTGQHTIRPKDLQQDVNTRAVRFIRPRCGLSAQPDLRL